MSDLLKGLFTAKEVPTQSKYTILVIGSILFTASAMFVGTKIGVKKDNGNNVRKQRRRDALPVSEPPTGSIVKAKKNLKRYTVRILDKAGRDVVVRLEANDVEDFHQQLRDYVHDLDFDSIQIVSEKVEKGVITRMTEPISIMHQNESGHTDVVCVVKVLPDKKYFLSGSRDGTIKLWEIATQKCVKTYVGHHGTVTDIDFLLHQKLFVSSSSDRTLKFWNLETGQCIDTWVGPQKNIQKVIVNDDQIYSAGYDGCIRMWNIENRSCDEFIDAHEGVWVTGLSFSDKYLVSAGQDGVVKMWNIYNSDSPIRTIQAHKGCINDVTYFQDDQQLCFLTGGDDGQVKLWREGVCARTYTGHTNAISSLCITTDNDILSGSIDASIRLWNTLTGEETKVFVGHLGAVNSVCQINPDNFISASSDKTIKLWNITTGQCMGTFGKFE